MQLLPAHFYRQRRKTIAQNGRSPTARNMALERQTMDRSTPRRRRIRMALFCSSDRSNFPSHHLTRTFSLLLSPDSRQPLVVAARSLDGLSFFVPFRHCAVVGRRILSIPGGHLLQGLAAQDSPTLANQMLSNSRSTKGRAPASIQVKLEAIAKLNSKSAPLKL